MSQSQRLRVLACICPILAVACNEASSTQAVTAVAPSAGTSAAQASAAGVPSTGRPAAPVGGTGGSGSSAGRAAAAAASGGARSTAVAAAGGGAAAAGGGPSSAGTAGAAPAAGSSPSAGSGQPAAGAGAAPGAGSAENDLGDCTVGALPEPGALPAIAKLPDPFTRLDGTRIANKADWHCRQAEIRKQAETYAYGSKPAKPQSVTGTVTDSELTVKVTEAGKSTSFSAKLVLPAGGTPPYSAIIVYGGLGLGFGVPMDAGVLKSEGVALIQYDVGVTGKEGTGRSNKQGAFYDIAGRDSRSGLLIAWSWGVSRMIDVIEQSDGKLLRADAVAVTGCSRFGKGAFVAGAFDQRIPLTMPIESGTGGVPIWRGISAEGAQTLSSAYSEQPWFGDAFSAFTGSPTKAPIDTHEIIGLIAPRGLFIMDNPSIANLGPKAAHVASLAGAQIYQALGAGENISYFSAVQSGSHCAVRPEWAAPLKSNIQRFLSRTGRDPGVIKAAANATGDVSSWVDWTAPALK